MSDQPTPSLAHYPITFFAVVMGLSGLALAIRAAGHTFDLGLQLDALMLALVGLVFVAVALVYVLKWMRFPAAVSAEWNHPVRLSFFPAISISLLLLAALALPVHEGMARVLWLAGAVGQFGLTLAVVSGWIGGRSFQTPTLNPAWFIPAVGNVVAPLAGPALGYVEVSWYFMSVGLIFWLVLLALVFNRLIFHDPLPARLQPTLVILIAPPAIGFMAWLRLTGEIDALARVLINTAWFFSALVALQLPRILRLPFAMSFWALSFPIAAVTIATLTYAAEMQKPALQWLGGLLFVVLAVVIAGLVIRTIRGLISGEVLLPE
jgi:tellurite resistance protein